MTMLSDFVAANRDDSVPAYPISPGTDFDDNVESQRSCAERHSVMLQVLVV